MVHSEVAKLGKPKVRKRIKIHRPLDIFMKFLILCQNLLKVLLCFNQRSRNIVVFSHQCCYLHPRLKIHFRTDSEMKQVLT